jgi:hypothetical protein
MLDAKLGESSKWQSSPDLVKPQDSSTPGMCTGVWSRGW